MCDPNLNLWQTIQTCGAHFWPLFEYCLSSLTQFRSHEEHGYQNFMQRYTKKTEGLKHEGKTIYQTKKHRWRSFQPVSCWSKQLLVKQSLEVIILHPIHSLQSGEPTGDTCHQQVIVVWRPLNQEIPQQTVRPELENFGEELQRSTHGNNFRQWQATTLKPTIVNYNKRFLLVVWVATNGRAQRLLPPPTNWCHTYPAY